MKVIKEITRKDGVRIVTVQISESEELKAIKDGCFYRLGGQLDDIVGAHCIAEMQWVYWCSIEQNWVDA